MDLFPEMQNRILSQFNDGLNEMRELFHQSGRLEDSNSKLDEITKMLSLEIVAIRDSAVQVPELKTILADRKGGRGFVTRLNDALLVASRSRILRNYDGESLLGPNPKFNLSDSEEALARKLTEVVVIAFNGYLRGTEHEENFELLNEAFSHFVRDNFRQNIEDAQYMTPVEVVNFMVTMSLKALEGQKAKNDQVVVCDPSCGVGSFLAQFHRTWIQRKEGKQPPLLVGQDKVDRMARLSLLNLYLFGINTAKVSRGNSLSGDSPLDAITGKCDLILTNPPFGARFETDTLLEGADTKFPCLSQLIRRRSTLMDSEILFVDRYMSLLKPGGTAFAVLPDSVFSAKGLPATLREELLRRYVVKSITELPAVTFAQAGTRTKTCVLEIQKSPPRPQFAFMSKIGELGFEVSSRKGVPYKKETGQNELVPLLDCILKATVKDGTGADLQVLLRSPSCVLINQERLGSEGWTPSHYSSERVETVRLITDASRASQFDVVTLAELVELPPKKLTEFYDPGKQKCISVLHIGDFGALNFRELMAYIPKTPSRRCAPGDLLFSKINPRIPRAIIVPELPYALSCSSEFEVLRPVGMCTSHELMLLLLSEYAQNQIRSLTSGTSSSHNRIKTKELLSIRLPIPRKGSKLRRSYEKSIADFKDASTQLNVANGLLFESWKTLNKAFS